MPASTRPSPSPPPATDTPAATDVEASPDAVAVVPAAARVSGKALEKRRVFFVTSIARSTPHPHTPQPTADPTELILIICAHLRAAGLTDAASAVAAAARDAGTVPTRLDVSGTLRTLTDAQLASAVARVPPTALAALAGDALARASAFGGPPLAGVASLLAGGGAALAAALAPPPPPPTRPPSGKRQDEALPQPLLSLPWRHAPHRGAPLPALVALRAAGASATSRSATAVEPPARAATALRHAVTLRGHRAAVYCVAYDATGDRVITGADDALVKIWCSRTARLLAMCRGHTAEVTDVGVSGDGAAYASASEDGSVRVWEAGGAPPGAPGAVLLGHAPRAATFLSWCRRPDAPHLLLSTGADGTLRAWDTRPPGTCVAVLTAARVFGPTRGVTRFGGGAAPPPPRTTRRGDAALADAVRAADAARRVAERLPTRTALAEAARTAAELEALRERLAAARGLPPPSREATPDPPPDASPPALLVCSTTPDGTHMLAGGADGSVFVWSWDLDAAPRDASAAATLPRPSADGGLVLPASDVPPPLILAASPPPVELVRLEGHTAAVHLLRLSRSGGALATGSKDGTLRLWRRPTRAGRLRAMWVATLAFTTDPVEDHALAVEARRWRRDPPPRIIRQLAWTCDDNVVIAAMGDYTVRAWHATTGAAIGRMRGHVDAITVVDCHPFDPALLLTAAADGRAIVWHVPTCTPLASFSTRDTAPRDAPAWPEALPVVDGRWAGDGAAFCLTDAAGQLHLFDSAPPTPALARARYDQFLEHDYGALRMDAAGFVVDADTEHAPHALNAGARVVDFLGQPYPPSYQAAFAAHALTDLTLAEAEAEAEGAPPPPPRALPRGAALAPPTLTAAAWAAQEAGRSDDAVTATVARAEARMAAATAAAPAPPPLTGDAADQALARAARRVPTTPGGVFPRGYVPTTLAGLFRRGEAAGTDGSGDDARDADFVPQPRRGPGRPPGLRNAATRGPSSSSDEDDDSDGDEDDEDEEPEAPPPVAGRTRGAAGSGPSEQSRAERAAARAAARAPPPPPPQQRRGRPPPKRQRREADDGDGDGEEPSSPESTSHDDDSDSDRRRRRRRRAVDRPRARPPPLQRHPLPPRARVHLVDGHGERAWCLCAANRRLGRAAATWRGRRGSCLPPRPRGPPHPAPRPAPRRTRHRDRRRLHHC